MERDIDRAEAARRACPFLNTAQAAFYLDLSVRTLLEFRQHREGPRYRRHGRHIRYHVDDLDAWSLSSSDGHG